MINKVSLEGMAAVHIVFLYPPTPYLVRPGMQVGLGLLCLASYAEFLGAKVTVLTEGASTIKEAVDAVPPCDALCMSGCLVDAPAIVEVACRVKAAKKCNFIIVGGPVGKSPQSLNTGKGGVDCSVSGSGEDVIEEIVIGRLGTLKRMRHVKRPMLPSQPVESYPKPNRALLPPDNIGGSIFYKEPEDFVRSTTLLTSRGCTGRCAFCTSGLDYGVASYSMARIEEEIEQAVGLGVTDFRVSDDNLLHDPERLEALCGLFTDYRCRWRASVRVRPNTIEMYKMMAASGCIEVSFGIESADPKVLDILHKEQTVEHSTMAVKNAREGGIQTVRGLLMMATPGETRRTLEHNKCWAAANPHVLFCMVSFFPFPGTAIYNAPEKFGCRIVSMAAPNIYAFRNDGTEPEAHIDIIDGLSRDELTRQLLAMRDFLVTRNQANHG